MSLFRTIESPCPTCRSAVIFEIVHSVNADRRPVLRSQMLDRSFQAETCPTCKTTFRVEPEFSYQHIGAKQFLSVWPISKLGQWDECERRSAETFDRFYGPSSSPAATAIGKELTARAVFGFEAAREKIVAAEHGIDDTTLELAKLALVRGGAAEQLGADVEWRLLGVDEGQTLVLGEFTRGVEQPQATIRVPKALLDEIEADAEEWQALRDELGQGPFVDVARLMIEPEPATAAAA